MIKQPADLSQIFYESVPELNEIEAPVKKEHFAEDLASRDLETEFQLLRAITDSKKHKLMLRTNGVIENKLNRYAQLEIYEFNRVVLKRSDPKQLDYINANIVTFERERFKSIITQGPLPTTIGDFFQMISQQKVDTILMACSVVEDGRVRCEAYFDNLPEPYKLESVQELCSRKIIRRFLRNQDTHEIVTHLHYTDWPDKDIPKDFASMSQLLELTASSTCIAIHCSAGIGRSGAQAVLLDCWRQAKKTGQIGVFRAARRVREQRYGAIQNFLQYNFIYDYLQYAIETKAL